MHYTVLVLRKANNNKCLGEILAPYDENLEVEPYIDMTYDIVAELGKEHLSKNDDIKIIDINQWRKKDFYNYYRNEFLSGCDTDENGNILSTYNPESKYDWYQVGGRFSGLLKIKKDAIYKYSINEDSEDLYVDKALKGDIDWDSLTTLSAKNPEKEYYTKFWKYYVEGQEPPEEDAEIVKKIFANTYYPNTYYLKYRTLENYLKIIGSFCTHSVVTDDGRWHEEGQNLWLSSSESKEEDDWAINFYDRFIKDLPDDTELIVVDCHI